MQIQISREKNTAQGIFSFFLICKHMSLGTAIQQITADVLREQLFNRFDVKSRAGLAMDAILHDLVSF